MLGNYRIGTKLLSGFLTVALLAVGVGGVGLYSMNTLQARTNAIGDVLMPSLRGIGLVGLGVADLRGLEGVLLQTKREKDEPGYARAKQNLQVTTTDEIEKGWKLYEPLAREPDEDIVWKRFVSEYSAYQAHLKTFIALLDANKVPEAAQLLATGEKLSHAASADADRIATLQDKFTVREVGDAHAAGSRGRWQIVIGLLLALLFSVITGFVLSRDVTVPLKLALQRAERLRAVCVTNMNEGLGAMARGDLSVVPVASTEPLNMSRRDEIGELAATVDGTIATIRDTINSFVQTQQVVRDVINESATLNARAIAGDLQQRGDAQRFQGAFRELVEGVNKILDAVITPVNEASDVLVRIADRDLSARVRGNYAGDHAKIKTSINTAAENLEAALSEMIASARQVSSASGAIASGSQTLAQNTSDQAASVEEISSSLQEIEAMVQQSTQSAQDARGLAEGAKVAVESGETGMRELMTAMDRIKQSSDATTKIVKTIDEIAFQTNLLALNAAVEAARAGDAGRGFAVVAEEVRALALRAGEAAKTTAALIEQGAQNALAGVTASDRVSTALSDISSRTSQVTTVMGEIVAASDQQRVGVEQVNVAVTQMSAGTQSAAATAEESASSAEELAAQATMMQEVVNAFRLTNSATAVVAPARPSSTGARAHQSRQKAARRVVEFAEF